MGFFDRFFGGGARQPLPLEEVGKLVSPLAAPAIQFVPAPGETPCYFGGEPQLPAGVAWPEKAGRPLPFLASIDLPSVAAAIELEWLPRTGRLLFFYDVDEQPWGFDPKDRGGWTVLYEDERAAAASSTTTVKALPMRFVSARRIASLPSYERPEISALGMSDDQSDALIELGESVYGGMPCHQMGGFPNPVQGDAMELECQLASNGMYAGEPSSYAEQRAKALADGAGDWRLLLQVDSDDSLDVMWGDAGIIYFFIREQDARARRFDCAWLVLQCH